MAFWAHSFVFDDIPSETYGLFLISDGGAGVLENVGSNAVEPYTQEIHRRPKPYFFGVQQTPVLTFSLSFASLKPVDALQQQIIQRWLFGHNSYKKLQIMQCDMESVYFNCILNNPTLTTVGNYAYTFKCDVVCDAPWAWEFPKSESFGPFLTEGTFKFNNISDDNYYMKPVFVIEIGNNADSFQLLNQSDGNKGCTFNDLSPGETLTIDSDKYIVTSNTGLLRVGNMTGILPRLVPGMNTFQVIGSTEKITINYQNARKVSG